MSDLYESDILAWSEQQAALLRQIAAGERINSNELHWSNIAEEIESVGKEQVHRVRSLLMRALEHDLKAEAWPLAPYVDHWRAEAIRFRIEAADRFTASMRAKIDLAAIYRRALRAMPARIDGVAPLPVPWSEPFTVKTDSDGHIRWWSHSTTGNIFDLGTVRVSGVDPGALGACVSDFGAAVVNGGSAPPFAGSLPQGSPIRLISAGRLDARAVVLRCSLDQDPGPSWSRSVARDRMPRQMTFGQAATEPPIPSVIVTKSEVPVVRNFYEYGCGAA
jgi:hypothetical protein